MKLLNKVFLILGQRWAWKTSLATCIAADWYSKVLANYTITGLKNFEKYEDYDFLKSWIFKNKNDWWYLMSDD